MESIASARPRKHWMRVCAVVMAVLALIVVLSGEVSWWRVLLALLLLACPAVVIWSAWTFGRAENFQRDNPERNPRHEP